MLRLLCKGLALCKGFSFCMGLALLLCKGLAFPYSWMLSVAEYVEGLRV
jgi:hypothetical protein